MLLQKSQRKLLWLSSVGGILEFYDFIIYALLASYIAHNFFPVHDKIVSLLVTFATFSLGYLVRPIGGMIFAHYGDRYGRKKTFTLSILLMAIATFCIALMPTYQQIGISAPIVLTLLRIVQGIAVGGEIPGSIAYVSESIPEKKGLACGIIFFALINGIVLGSLMQAILTTLLSEQQMLSWGWRIPFLLGGLFGFLSYGLRQKLEESKVFKAIEDRVEKYPIISLMRSEPVNVIAATLMVGLGATIITLLFLFMPSYIHTVLHITSAHYIWYNTIAIFLSATLCIFTGWLADRINHKRLYFFMAFSLIAIAYPIFLVYSQHFSFFYIALGLSILINGLAWGIIPSLLVELFTTQVRYSGIAVAYNLGFAIFGGLAPLIALFLIDETRLNIAPVFYLYFIALWAIIANFYIKKRV